MSLSSMNSVTLSDHRLLSDEDSWEQVSNVSIISDITSLSTTPSELLLNGMASMMDALDNTRDWAVVDRKQDALVTTLTGIRANITQVMGTLKAPSSYHRKESTEQRVKSQLQDLSRFCSEVIEKVRASHFEAPRSEMDKLRRRVLDQLKVFKKNNHVSVRSLNPSIVKLPDSDYTVSQKVVSITRSIYAGLLKEAQQPRLET